MAALEVDTSKLIGSIAKVGLTLFLLEKGVSPETASLLPGFVESLISSVGIKKQPDMLQDFNNLVRQSIQETLENHEFVFEIKQIDIISESILSVEQLQGYLRNDSVDILHKNFISALDEIDYPYKPPNCEFDVDGLLGTILHKIHRGILKDPDLANLDTNLAVHENSEKLTKLLEYVRILEQIPHSLIELEPFQPESILHREGDVLQLAEKLQNKNHLLMITGIGGIGKTVLARVVYERVKSQFKHVAWLNYDGNLDNQLLKTRIKQNNPDPKNRLLQIKDFLNTVQEPVLIILDNITDKPPRKDLATLNSFSDNVRVLMTSRLPKIRGVEAYPIEFLSPEQCLDVFYFYYTRDKERHEAEIAKKIIDAVNRHTLTIELIARAAWDSNSLPEVWTNMQKLGFAYSELGIESFHEPDLHTIMEHTKMLFTMAGMDEAKRKIMRVFSILPHSSPIPIAIKDWMPCDVNDLKWLVDRGWIQRVGSAFSIHQMVQESVKLQENPNLEDCQGLIKAFSEDDYVPRTMVYTKAYERLALSDALIAWFEPAPEEPSFATFLHNTAYFHISSQGDYPKALAYYQKALDIREKVLGTDHPSTATTYNNMAGVYQDQGDYLKALAYNQKALDIREKVFGTDHPSTATIYNNMAGVYRDQGDYPKALAYYQKALEVREKVLGTDHPDTAATYNNIAGVYQDQGDFLKALAYNQKALVIAEKVLGTDHPDTASTYNNMAVVYQDQGDYPRALAYYQKTLVIVEKVLGTDHPDTASTYNNMALVYRAKGDYPRALAYYQKALEVRKKVLGTDHPDTASTYNNMAMVYQAQGDHPKALEYYLKSYKILYNCHGPDHPTTKIVLGNLKKVFYDSDCSENPLDIWLQEKLNQ